MAVLSIAPQVHVTEFLPGAQFVDAFSVEVADPGLDAWTAAEFMLCDLPKWVTALMAVRDLIVAPLGLKKTTQTSQAGDRMIGMFPVISLDPARLVAGFDDQHLDARLIVDVSMVPGGKRVVATTIIFTHNLLGRSYLKVITPFHCLIVQALLARVSQKSRRRRR